MNAFGNLSPKKLQKVAAVTSRPISECITMEAEPRIAKQYKCHHCCSCKNYRGKGMEGGKKVFLRHFLADQKIASSWKKIFFGHSIAQSDYGPSRMHLKLAV